MTNPAEPTALVELLVDDPRWDAVDLQTLAERAARATLRELDVTGAYEISVLACDDARIAALNGQFRAKPTPTNVLSWPAGDLAPAQPGALPPPPQGCELGDIALAFDTVTAEAQTEGLSLSHHILHLLVHGTLHLLGFDHETDADAHVMEGIEVAALARLGVPDPY
ncbi:MAG: rRNA maturation RNase YbeY [Pseudomonadota bacterium]